MTIKLIKRSVLFLAVLGRVLCSGSRLLVFIWLKFVGKGREQKREFRYITSHPSLIKRSALFLRQDSINCPNAYALQYSLSFFVDVDRIVIVYCDWVAYSIVSSVTFLLRNVSGDRSNQVLINLAWTVSLNSRVMMWMIEGTTLCDSGGLVGIERARVLTVFGSWNFFEQGHLTKEFRSWCVVDQRYWCVLVS